MAEDGSPGPAAAPPTPRTAPGAGSLPLEAQRDVRIASYLALLAIAFVVVQYLGAIVGIGAFGFLLLFYEALFVVLIYALIYHPLTRGEVSRALGATLPLGLLSLLLGLPLFLLGLLLGPGGEVPLFLYPGIPPTIFIPTVLARVLLILGVGAGVLLLIAYVLGARAERKLQRSPPPSGTGGP